MKRVVAWTLLLAAPLSLAADEQQSPPPPGWENVRSLKMSGGLRAFWDISSVPRHRAEAIKRGFDPVNLLGDYNDCPGQQKGISVTTLESENPPIIPVS